MMKPSHASNYGHLTVERLGMSPSFARRARISTVRDGWNFTLGSGVT